MRRKAVIFCCTLLTFVSVSCAGARNSRILRENPGPGADSYREAGESSGGEGGSGYVSDGEGGSDNVSGGEGGSGSASGGAGGGSLAERLLVPEVYEASIQSEDGTFQLTCDAGIELPDASRIPVFEVGHKEIDQEWIDCVTETFFGNAPIYEGDSYIPDPEIFGNDVENPMEKKESRPRLEDSEQPPESPEYNSYYFYGIAEMEETLFSYKLRWIQNNSLQINILRKKPEALNEVLYWDSGYFQSEETTTYPRPSREEAERIAGITPEQAQETAKEYLKRLKMDEFSPQNTCLGVCYYYTGNVYGPNDAQYIDAGYLVSCTREVQGISVTDEKRNGIWTEPGLDELPKWGYEKVEFFVNEEGLQEFRLNNMYSIEEQQAADIELLSFPEIAEIFEQAIQMNYENTDALQTDIHIDRVQFGYMRVYNPGVDHTRGILIPVWDFFGSRVSYGSKIQEEQKDYVFKRAEPNESILTINASDGMIIDRQLGY